MSVENLSAQSIDHTRHIVASGEEQRTFTTPFPIVSRGACDTIGVAVVVALAAAAESVAIATAGSDGIELIGQEKGPSQLAQRVGCL